MPHSPNSPGHWSAEERGRATVGATDWDAAQAWRPDLLLSATLLHLAGARGAIFVTEKSRTLASFMLY